MVQPFKCTCSLKNISPISILELFETDFKSIIILFVLLYTYLEFFQTRLKQYIKASYILNQICARTVSFKLKIISILINARNYNFTFLISIGSESGKKNTPKPMQHKIRKHAKIQNQLIKIRNQQLLKQNQ